MCRTSPTRRSPASKSRPVSRSSASSTTRFARSSVTISRIGSRGALSPASRRVLEFLDALEIARGALEHIRRGVAGQDGGDADGRFDSDLGATEVERLGGDQAGDALAG